MAPFGFELSVVAVVWQRLFARTEIFHIKPARLHPRLIVIRARASDLTKRRDDVDIRLSPRASGAYRRGASSVFADGICRICYTNASFCRVCAINANESVRKVYAYDLCFTIPASYGGNPVPELKQCRQALLRSWDTITFNWGIRKICGLEPRDRRDRRAWP